MGVNACNAVTTRAHCNMMSVAVASLPPPRRVASSSEELPLTTRRTFGSERCQDTES